MSALVKTSSNSDNGLGDVKVKLAGPLIDQGYQVFFYNFCTSVGLGNDFYHLGTPCCGTASICKVKRKRYNVLVKRPSVLSTAEQSFKNEVLKLNTKKSSTSGSIPATILKQSVETYLPFLTKAIHLAITECESPDKLKKSEVIPL